MREITQNLKKELWLKYLTPYMKIRGQRGVWSLLIFVEGFSRFVVVRGALPRDPEAQNSASSAWLCATYTQGSTAPPSEIRAPEEHVGTDLCSGVYPTEPTDPEQR